MKNWKVKIRVSLLMVRAEIPKCIVNYRYFVQYSPWISWELLTLHVGVPRCPCVVEWIVPFSVAMFLFAKQKQNTFVTAVTNFTSKVIKQFFYIHSTSSYHRFVSDLWFLCGIISWGQEPTKHFSRQRSVTTRAHTHARASAHTHILPIVAHALVSWSTFLYQAQESTLQVQTSSEYRLSFFHFLRCLVIKGCSKVLNWGEPVVVWCDNSVCLTPH